jgi:hypothetical protein
MTPSTERFFRRGQVRGRQSPRRLRRAARAGFNATEVDFSISGLDIKALRVGY